MDPIDNSANNVKRNVFTQEEKLELIKRYENGEKVVDIASAVSLPRTTVWHIVHKSRGYVFNEMERRLSSRLIKRQTEAGKPMTSDHLIRIEAKSIFQDLLEEFPDEKDRVFNANSNWLKRFMKGSDLLVGMTQGQATAANSGTLNIPRNDGTIHKQVPDKVAAQEFLITLQKIIEVKEFLPEQIFNVDVISLYWKRLPGKSFISDRLSLMLGCNCTGDLKLKPLLVYHTANPKDIMNVPKAYLPVIWSHGPNAEVTVGIFEDWFINHFIPTVKSYCNEKFIPFKALLILDNAPYYPSNLCDFDPNVVVLYLPRNTASLIHPMGQGVTALFKRFYLRRILRQAVDATSQKADTNLRKFWNNYNIYQAILNISSAWSEVLQPNLNETWKGLCPQFVYDSKGFLALFKDLSKDLVSFSADLGHRWKEEDFERLFKADQQPLSSEELRKLEGQRCKEEEDDRPEPNPKRFTIDAMRKGFFHLSQCLATFEAQDPNAERFAKIMNGADNLFLPYRTILNEKRTIAGTSDQFQTKVKKPKTFKSKPDNSGSSKPPVVTL